MSGLMLLGVPIAGCFVEGNAMVGFSSAMAVEPARRVPARLIGPSPDTALR